MAVYANLHFISRDLVVEVKPLVGDVEALWIYSDTDAGSFCVDVTESLKDQLRDVVRAWDMDDEAEVRGEHVARTPWDLLKSVHLYDPADLPLAAAPGESIFD